MNTLEILTAARAKIADEKNWCQEAFARDNDYDATRPKNPEACSWCSKGAIFAVVGEVLRTYVYLDILEKYMEGDVPDYNDSRTHAEVMAAWDKAIAGCAKEGV
jgi:hypothetical protein